MRQVTKSLLEQHVEPHEPPKICQLCGRHGQVLNFHHLIPRALHSNKWFEKRYSKEFMRHHGIWICKNDCHKNIHVFVSEKDMGLTYNTREKLLEEPQIRKYVDWVSKR